MRLTALLAAQRDFVTAKHAATYKGRSLLTAHRVGGGSRPPPPPTERSVQISRTIRSSGVDSQHYESLQRPVGQPQSWSEQRDPLLEPVEGGPGKVAACPAAATEHLAPVTLDEPMHPLQRADVAGDTIVGVVPAEGEIECVDLFLDRPVSCLPHLIAQ